MPWSVPSQQRPSRSGTPLETAGDVAEPVQVAARGEEPDAAVAVGFDGVAGEEGDGGVVDELLPGGIPAEDVLVRDPDHAVAVHGDVGRADQAAGGAPPDRPVLAGLQVVETDAEGGDEPEPVLAVFHEAHGQAVQDVAGGIFKLLEMQSVIHADAFARAKPDQSVAVLEDGTDGIIGEPVVRAEIPEADGSFLGERGEKKRYQEG